jgi:hypothetical protein
MRTETRRPINAGWFKRGEDPRRRKFTSSEARRAGKKGWCAALARHPQLYSWLRIQVLGGARRVG